MEQANNNAKNNGNWNTPCTVFNKNRRSISLFNFSVQFELNFSFHALEEYTIVYDRTKEGEGFLPLQISVVKRNTTAVTDRESGSSFTMRNNHALLKSKWDRRDRISHLSTLLSSSSWQTLITGWTRGSRVSSLATGSRTTCWTLQTALTYTIKYLMMRRPRDDRLQAAEITLVKTVHES